MIIIIIYFSEFVFLKVTIFFWDGHLVSSTATYLSSFATKSNDYETLFIYEHVKLHVTSYPFFWHAHPWSLLFMMTLCKTKGDIHSFLNQWEI